MTGRSPRDATDHPSWLVWLILCAAAAAASIYWLPAVEALFGVALAALCIVLAKTDLEHFVLPDYANLLVFLLGLSWAGTTSANSLQGLGEAIIRSVLAGGVLYLVGIVYQLTRGRSGLGFGDVKLVAAAAPWITSSQLVTTILIAAAAGIVLAMLRWLIGRGTLNDRIPFGALLAPAVWLVWFAGEAQLLWFDR